MAVNLKAPVAEDILPVSGVVLGTAEAGIKQVVFDRGGYLYTGRVANVAEGAREAGLDF